MKHKNTAKHKIKHTNKIIMQSKKNKKQNNESFGIPHRFHR
jgi:hypothetical protein